MAINHHKIDETPTEAVTRLLAEAGLAARLAAGKLLEAKVTRANAGLADVPADDTNATTLDGIATTYGA